MLQFPAKYCFASTSDLWQGDETIPLFHGIIQDLAHVEHKETQTEDTVHTSERS